MNLSEIGLPSVSESAGVTALVGFIAVSWFANPQSLDQRLAPTRPKARRGVPEWRRGVGGSLALWALECGAAVILLHDATTEAGPRLGAYRTGLATLALIALAAGVALRHSLASALPHAFLRGARSDKLQNPPSQNVALTSRSIKPKTWQRLHIALAIGAMLPLWWHCDPGRASTADLLLKGVVISLLTSGFLIVAITDLSRWRLLSPMFSPRLSAGLIISIFTVHRWLALLTFILIAVHVLVVLYFAGA